MFVAITTGVVYIGFIRQEKVQLTCTGCGKQFLRHACHAKKGFKTVWCSRECWGVSTTNKCKCLTCGKEYTKSRTLCGQKYCSVTCYWQAVGRIEERKCEQCKKTFKPTQRTKANRFCSSTCYGKSRRVDPEVLRQRRLAYVRKYRKEHPEWTRLQKNKRRALELGAEGSFTKEEWDALKEKHGHRCAHCKEKKKLTIDHIKSLTKGGSNYISNIQPLCSSCNSTKWIKELNEIALRFSNKRGAFLPK